MNRLLAAGVALLSLAGLPALAQVSSETTTSQTTVQPGMSPPSYSPALAPPPAPAAPPEGVLSTTRTAHAVDAYGNHMDSQSSTYHDSQGVAEDKRTTTVITAPPPPPPMATSTSTTTNTTTQPQ